MKKIIFIIILFLSCYFIYEITKSDKINYTTLGDSLAKGVTPYSTNGYGFNNYLKEYFQKNNQLKSYNDDFTKADYRITDLINHITNNTQSKNLTINQVIHNSDIITISIGMNELYYKLKINDNYIYSYIDEMINDTNTLFKLLRKNNNNKIYMLGYYNITNNNKDIFTYANTKLQALCQKYNIIYINTEQIFQNNKTYFENPHSYNPNLEGYYKIYEKVIEKITNN